MSSLSLPDNHFIITSTSAVSEICKPLFDSFNLNGFIYVKFYDAGHFSCLLDNPQYPKLAFSSDCPLIAPLPKELLHKKQFFYLAETCEDEGYQRLLNIVRVNFNVAHPLYMVEMHQGYFEIFGLISNPNNRAIINTYLNNMDIFEKFKFYFREKASRLLRQTEKYQISIPTNLKLDVNSTCTEPHWPQLREQFTKQLAAHRYRFTDPEITLTKREMECLYYLGKGYRLKDIGRQLELSPRTVESHLNKVKDKSNCYTRRELITLISKITL